MRLLMLVADHNSFHHYSKNFKALLSCFQDKQGFFSPPKKRIVAAEFLLTFALEETFARAGSLATVGIRGAWGLKGQLQDLKGSVTMNKAVLQNAEKRKVTDESMKLCLEKLQDVAYDAEDVLDHLMTLLLRCFVKTNRKSLLFVIKIGFVFYKADLYNCYEDSVFVCYKALLYVIKQGFI